MSLPPAITLTEADAGRRLDAVLFNRFPDYPRALLKEAFAAGLLRCDGKIAPKGLKTRTGMKISIAPLPDQDEQFAIPNPDILLDIITEDDALIAFNKPAGLPCHPNKRQERQTLANDIAARWPELRGIGDTPLMTGILHRIDTDTSGLVLAARTPEIYTALREQFQARQVKKIYIALVSGTLTRPAVLEHDLAHHPNCPGRMVNAAIWKDARRPMHAVTAYRPLQNIRLHNTPFTLLEVTIHTGVTHQIRAQLSLSGHPILGDRRYGGTILSDFPRHFLHASAITFLHPLTSELTTLHAPLTPDLSVIIPIKK